MSYKQDFKMSIEERQRRTFSEGFKRQKVREIISGKVAATEISKAYEVSQTAIYKWIDLYSGKQKPERTIVESKSDTSKILALQKRIAELERALGQKQIQLEFKDKMIELAEDIYKVDIKKKFGTKQ
jgi:transposase